MNLHIAPVEHVPEIHPGMNLGECLRDALLRSGLELERHDILGVTRALVEGDDDLRPGFEQRRDGTPQPGVAGGGRARVHVVAFVRRHEAERGKA